MVGTVGPCAVGVPAPLGCNSFVFSATPDACTASNVSLGSALTALIDRSAARDVDLELDRCAYRLEQPAHRGLLIEADTAALHEHHLPHHTLHSVPFPAACGYRIRHSSTERTTMTTAFAYDTVEYPSAALPQAHPGHLFAVARMFGLNPAPVERCRYLEVGCGDGTHLIACALVLPRATFVGVDLSTVAIERGNRMIAELGLSNVTLYAADLTKWEPPAHGFDYAVAHGFYSWVPSFVRDSLMSLYAKCLPKDGVGYVSYNTYPGCYARRMVWEMLKFHTASIDEPTAKIEQALEMVKFLAAGRSNREGGDRSLCSARNSMAFSTRPTRKCSITTTSRRLTSQCTFTRWSLTRAASACASWRKAKPTR